MAPGLSLLAMGVLVLLSTPLFATSFANGGGGADDGRSSYFETLDLDAVSPSTAEEDEVPFGGVLTTRWRSRWENGDDRHDVSLYFGADVGAAGSTKVSFHARGSTAFELDHEDESSGFDGLLQTYDEGRYVRLYDLYVDVHTVDELRVLRFGRQSDLETPEPAVYDGARVESAERGEHSWMWGAYGGRAVRYYDDAGGDALYGAYASLRPWEDGRMRIDWMHADDETVLGGVRDDLFSVEVWKRLREELQIGAFYSRLEDRNRDLRLDADLAWPEAGVHVSARYYELLQSQQFRATEFDPFSPSVGVWQPFRRVDLDLSKSIADDWNLRAGVDLRRVRDSADVGEFNRDYDRWFLGVASEESEERPWTLALTGDLWKGSGRDQWTWGIDAGRRLGSSTRGVVGTYYSLWKTDFALGEEREDVRTWFARVEHEVTDELELEGRYEYEDSSLLDFHILRVRATWSF